MNCNTHSILFVDVMTEDGNCTYDFTDNFLLFLTNTTIQIDVQFCSVLHTQLYTCANVTNATFTNLPIIQSYCLLGFYPPGVSDAECMDVFQNGVDQTCSNATFACLQIHRGHNHCCRQCHRLFGGSNTQYVLFYCVFSI
jgi:hypothetical protein